jgi:predicted acylesterase/phospholipase RssA
MSTEAQTSSTKITKEIRFAVVMYGGVSLAIYMNGIAQELLSLVRSTSKNSGINHPAGTESVYHELAEYLTIRGNSPFRHKFIIDIISGTSAGGINGICLAKGLVRGLDNLKVLENVWLEEGDIDKLLNDHLSNPAQFCPKEPKTSLFNSQRMFAKLLDAFRKMESEVAKVHESHVNSLDLFVTATDLKGQQAFITLSDGKAFERIHKHVFPFRYRQAINTGKEETVNNFTGKFDPILAFAARCTSSFPAAFEPVTLNDIFSRLTDSEKNVLQNEFEEFKTTFFSGISDNSEHPLKERLFADGGYLDNRPFGHAINAVHARHASCPLERKLLFIDPVPDNPESSKKNNNEISFIENSTLATISLPRYETIREEIENLKKRNEWIDSVHDIAKYTEKIINDRIHEYIEEQITELNQKILDYDSDNIKISFSLDPELKKEIQKSTNLSQDIIDDRFNDFWATLFEKKTDRILFTQASPTEPCAHPPTHKKFEENDLIEMVKLFGEGYISYHYSKLNLLTERLTGMIAHAVGIEKRPEMLRILSLLVHSWRLEHFKSTVAECIDNQCLTENIFLRNFDIDFRLRRLNYYRKLLENSLNTRNAKYILSREYTLHENEIEALKIFYIIVTDALDGLYNLQDQFFTSGEKHPLAQENAVLYLKKTFSQQQKDILINKFPQEKSQKSYTEIIKTICYEVLPEICETDLKNVFEDLMEKIHSKIFNNSSSVGIFDTKTVSTTIKNGLLQLSEINKELAVYLKLIYEIGYDFYDFTTFPLFAGGDYGEGTKVSIYRISPADATSLWNENEKTDNYGRKKHKLAGISIGAFGGFLDREWRRNDIMWGRLDAAERIITAVLPDKTEEIVKKYFIDKAHEIILRETVDAWLKDLKSTRFFNSRSGEQFNLIASLKQKLRDPEEIRDGENRINNHDHPSSLPMSKLTLDDKAIAANKYVPPEWKTEFIAAYDFHRDLEPEPNLRRIGRASGILSSMLDRIEPGDGTGKKIGSYLKKLNWVLLGMLDFSTPKSLKGVLFGYWLHLILLVSLVIFGGGLLLNKFYSTPGTGDPFINFALALLSIDIIILLFQHFLKTRVHRIACTPWKTWAARVLSGLISIAVMFVLIVLYVTISDSWSVFWTSFQKAYLKTFLHLIDTLTKTFLQR